jgi:integrase
MKKLQTASARAKLAVRTKPYFVSLGLGIALGYRRNQTGAGSWCVRVANGKGGNWLRNIDAIADDIEAANGTTILDFAGAQEKARAFAGRGDVSTEQPVTVNQALDAYAIDLAKRGKSTANAVAARIYLTPALAERPVSQLTARELRTWRDSLTANPSTINRNLKGFKAALSLAAQMDERIRNVSAWTFGLKALRDAEKPRDTFLTDDQVRALVAAAYAIDPAFGLFCEVAAVTGARPSQIARLEVRDLQPGSLQMPTSDKGRGERLIKRTSVPVPESLIVKLRAAAADRGPTEALLQRSNGRPWEAGSKDYQAPYRRAREAAGIPADVDFYSLRSSRIMRALKAGVAPLVIAKACDTSVAMIEKNYAARIANYAEDQLRRGLLDLAAPAAENVVPLRAA